MKFLFSISALLFGAASATVHPNHGFGNKLNAKKFKLEHDFMHAMHADGKIQAAAAKKREGERKRKLYEKLIAASVPKSEYDQKRALEEYNMGDSYEWMNPVYQQMVEDGVFDLTARSFKYSGCAAIKSFDTENAENNGTPLSVDTYAVFRLCPEDSCNKYSLTGCGKNYGEYVVEMSTYLEFMLDFYEDHYGAYCDYCYSCDYNYQVLKKVSQSQCYEDFAEQNYQENSEQQDSAWQDYYDAHYGDMSQYNSQKSQYQQQMQNQMNYANQQGSSNYYSAQNNGNRKLEDGSGSGYYSSFANYQSENNSGNGQANGQSYYNMYGAQQGEQNGVQTYGYYDDNGNYVNLCDSNGYTDENGQVYNFDCDGTNEYETSMRVCSDGQFCDECEYQTDQQFDPCDEYVCKDYYTYCSDLYEPGYKQMYNGGQAQNNNDDGNGNQNSNYNYQQQQQDNQLYQFLSCTEYTNEYGITSYVGPHCGSDHYTISLGVFTDENCVNFANQYVSLSKVLGYGYDDESFFHLPHECISCDGAQQFEDDEQRYNDMYTGYGVYGEYVEAPNEEFDDIVGMCAALFESSAQCNIHMSNYGIMAKYMEDEDAAYENRYCAFIDNIVYGSFDEQGEITLKADSFDFSDWKNSDQYKKMSMPAGQAIGLALSILLFFALGALAFITQRSLTRRGTPWRPRRFRKSVDMATPANPTPPLI
jgi:hypothetical protein